MRRLEVYFPAGAQYDVIEVIIRPDARYSPQESARRLLNVFAELPEAVIDEVARSPRFTLGRRSRPVRDDSKVR